jgi:alanyl-tRNA synthetase
MSKNNWWGKLTWEDYMKIFDHHEKDLEGLYGKFQEYSSFNEIMKLEHQRWQTTDESQTQKLKKLLVKKPVLTLEDWYTAVTSWGIPSDTIAKISKNQIPDNLYYYIDEKKARIVKAPEKILYETSHLPETVGLYFDHFKNDECRINDYEFNSHILEVFSNVSEPGRRNIVILDKSSFYPTSGGQANDIGIMSFLGQEYQVVNVEKVGKGVLHFLDKDVPEDLNLTYNTSTNTTSQIVKIYGKVDKKRRIQLRNHHTAAHIIFAACRQVLGPHVWQQGAKKTPIQAHLDITHYSSLTKEQELQIQETANRIVMDSHSIKKTVESKDHAEKEHGFRLYQGGVVPGNSLRVVEIDGVDVEACCGTHCDNTSEVGWIKVLTTKRIADGIVRLYFVAGERTIEKLNEETKIIHDLCKLLSIPQNNIIETSERIFKSYKKLNTDFGDAQKKILDLQVRYVIDNKEVSNAHINSEEEDPTLYFSIFSNYAQQVFESKKSILFLGKTFLFVYATDKNLINEAELKALLPGLNVAKMVSFGPKGKAVKDIAVLTVVSKTKLPDVSSFFNKLGFTELKI